MTESPARGLENVVVANTKLSAIDGTAGRLSYVGYDIHDLAERATYEEVFYLLWHGELPREPELRAFNDRLLAERALNDEELSLVRGIPAGGHGMDALRTLVSGLAQLDRQAEVEQVERVLQDVGDQSDTGGPRCQDRTAVLEDDVRRDVRGGAVARARHDPEEVSPGRRDGHAIHEETAGPGSGHR